MKTATFKTYEKFLNMVQIKISKLHQMWLFSIFTFAWCSGVAFFVLKTWFIVEGEFGPEKHPFQFTSLQIHGLIAFLMMITYGYFLGTHVQNTWKMKSKRTSGILLVAIPAFMMITAYLLYYIAKDRTREIIGYVHLGVGFILPLILTIHVIQKKKKPNIRNENSLSMEKAM
jgi:hypothetical protein